MVSRTRARRWVALVVAGLMLASSVAAEAQSEDDLRSERERLREEQATTAAEVDVAEAETDEVLDALGALEANVRAEEAHLDDAQRAVAAAEERVAEAQEAEAAAQARVEELRATMAGMAVDAYVSPPEQDNLTIVLTGELSTAPERQALLEMSASNQADVLERYRAAVEDREIQTQTAEQARQRAEEARAEVERRLGSVAEARDDQAGVAAQAQMRLDEMLQEQRRLEEAEDAITTELAERERRRQAELQAALERASARRGPANVPGHGSIELVRVGGITVNAQIADQLGAMLEAAAADGITLTGGGYRDSAQQISLRRAHCGSSNYAVYEMSPSRCRPPTARPGSSLHERGLAIDFVANGRSITSRSHAGFQWLAANAAQYGFRNLPSEPWHWSTTGG
ncbi:MAG: D-alanyl-D-alanine carboxypeptidase family protein [Acidimicrobiales bacterium]